MLAEAVTLGDSVEYCLIAGFGTVESSADNRYQRGIGKIGVKLNFRFIAEICNSSFKIESCRSAGNDALAPVWVAVAVISVFVVVKLYAVGKNLEFPWLRVPP